MIGLDQATARRLVLKYLVQLSARPVDTPFELSSLEMEVGRWHSEEQGDRNPPPNDDWTIRLGANRITMVHEVVWDLIVQRVLTLSRFQGQPFLQAQNWKFLRLTGYGSEVVKDHRWSPYDPDGYLKELAGQAPNASRLGGIYVKEALRCFSGGSYLATAVMLGAASESVVSNLFQRLLEAMKANGQMPEFDAYERKLSKAHSVFDRYGEFKKRFEPLRGKLPGHLNDDLDLQLDGVFNLIRYYRNSSGHPTGTTVERMTAFTSLVLFVPYCKRIEDMGNWIEKHARELHR